jgi:hypothetical protein
MRVDLLTIICPKLKSRSLPSCPYNRVKSLQPVFGPLTFDINFDSVPPASSGKYGLTTNCGTTEHVQGVYEPIAARRATDRYQLVVDGEYYSVRRAQQVTKEVSYANLNEMPAVDIARYLGNRVVRRLNRSFGH